MEGAAGPHPMSAEEKTAMEDAASESPVVKDSASPDSQRAPFNADADNPMNNPDRVVPDLAVRY